jgi:cyclic-di-GMP-binding protein
MPSFDVVTEVEIHELSNAVDQTAREISTRFDLKGTPAGIEFQNPNVLLKGEQDFQLKQVVQIFITKCAKRNIDTDAFKIHPQQSDHSHVKQTYEPIVGIESDVAKSITKLVKNSKIKVQSSIQDKKVRITGKKRDDLQQVMNLLKEANLSQPLQFNNFRD